MPRFCSARRLAEERQREQDSKASAVTSTSVDSISSEESEAAAWSLKRLCRGAEEEVSVAMTLTKERIEGKELLEQILTAPDSSFQVPWSLKTWHDERCSFIDARPDVSKAFGAKDRFGRTVFDSPRDASISEATSSHAPDVRPPPEGRRALRDEMQKLAEQRQADAAKVQRRSALKLLRQRVGPKPSDSTLHGILSRCEGDVNRAANAFWHGLPWA